MKFPKRATFNHTREDSPLVPCPECAIDMYWEMLLRIGRTLASNLAIGAALCDSFISGRAYQMAEDIDPATKQWRPGHAIDTLRAALEKP